MANLIRAKKHKLKAKKKQGRWVCNVGLGYKAPITAVKVCTNLFYHFLLLLNLLLIGIIC